MVMEQKLQYLSAMYSLFLIRIFGLWPYTVNLRTKAFKTTWFLKLQPFLTGTICLITISVIYRKLIPLLNIQWKSDSSKVLLKVYGAFNTITLITTYISGFLQTKGVKSIIVRSQEFMVKSQRKLNENTIKTILAILIYLLKSFVLLICFTTLICLKLYFASPLLPIYVLPFVAVPGLIISTVPNLFFGAIIIAKVYFERINGRIAEIVRTANWLTLQKQTHFGQMHLYCELSDILDELAVLHMELTRLTQDLCTLCNVHVTGYITWLAINAVVQEFLLYMSVSMMNLYSNPTSLVVFNVLTISIVWIELIMFAHLCFTIMHEVVLTWLLNWHFVIDEDISMVNHFKILSFCRHKRVWKSYTNYSYQ